MYPPLFILITTVNGAGALIFPPRRIEARVGAFTEYLTSSVARAPQLVICARYTNNFLRMLSRSSTSFVLGTPKDIPAGSLADAIMHPGLAPLRYFSTGSQ